MDVPNNMTGFHDLTAPAQNRMYLKQLLYIVLIWLIRALTAHTNDTSYSKLDIHAVHFHGIRLFSRTIEPSPPPSSGQRLGVPQAAPGCSLVAAGNTRFQRETRVCAVRRRDQLRLSATKLCIAVAERRVAQQARPIGGEDDTGSLRPARQPPGGLRNVELG